MDTVDVAAIGRGLDPASPPHAVEEDGEGSPLDVQRACGDGGD
jgi:hypothetical protein